MLKLRIYFQIWIFLLCVTQTQIAGAFGLPDMLNLSKYTGTDPKLSCTVLPNASDGVKDAYEVAGGLIYFLVINNDMAIIKKQFSMLDQQAEGGPPDEAYRNPLANYINATKGGNPKIPVPGGGIGDEIRCNQPTPDIKFVFNNTPITIKENMEHIYTDAGWFTTESIKFRAERVADRLCVQTYLKDKWRNIGCKPAMHPVVIRDVINVNKLKKDAGCSMAQSCTEQNARYSVSLIPFTGPLVQCVTESISGFFYGCGHSKATMFIEFQNRMRNLVKILLTLYVSFFAFKIMLGRDLPKKGDIFVFLLKFVFVLYFSVGIIGQSGINEYRNGTTEYLLPTLNAATISLANVMLRAGQSNNLCQYEKHDYKDSKHFHDLSMWDALDCRISYYLGLTNPHQTLSSSIAGEGLSMVGAPVMLVSMPILLTIIPSVMGYQIFLALFTIVFCIGLIAMVISFVNMYILSILGLNIMVYLAPLFIPLALFQTTKSYFDAWFKQVLAYSLQPMIITTFIGLIFTLFDQTIYTNCQFTKHSLPGFLANNSLIDDHSFFNSKAKIFTMSDIQSKECKESPGYIINEMSTKNSFTDVVFGFISMEVIKKDVANRIMPAMLYLAILGFLCWHFTELLTGLAFDLTGGLGLVNRGISVHSALTETKNLAQTIGKMMGGKEPPSPPKKPPLPSVRQ